MTWSESVVHRRRAITRSDSDSTEAKESISPPPPPESLLPAPPQSPTRKYSSCSCRKSNVSLRKRSEFNCVVPDRIVDKKGKGTLLQQMEAKLYNSELEEVMHNERLEQMQERLHRMAQLLEAQMMYAQSLDLKARAIARLTQLTGNFAYKELNPSEMLARTLDKISWDANLLEKLNDVQSQAFSATEAPEQLDQMLDEFRDKRKDYQTASITFSQFLRNASRVSSSQLRKFEGQFDSIRSVYDCSRHVLETEFPKLIEERREVLHHCFSKLVPVQERFLEQDKQFLILSREVLKSLQEPSKKVSQHRGCGDMYPQHLSKTAE